MPDPDTENPHHTPQPQPNHSDIANQKNIRDTQHSTSDTSQQSTRVDSGQPKKHMSDTKDSQNHSETQPQHSETDIANDVASTGNNAKDDKTPWWSIGFSRAVFLPSASIVTIFVLLAIIVPEALNKAINIANETIIDYLGWYYVLIINGFIIVALYVAFSSLGDIKLGKDDDEPQFGFFTWFAMLFSAGIGIGLVFWGVAEPLTHYAFPPPGSDPATPAQAGQQAMSTTYLHWGLHAWAVYVIIGLGVAYSHHRKGRPISMRWMVEPLLGDRVKGKIGDLIDIISIVGTLFGVATSLGFGVTQVSSGFSYLEIVDPSISMLLIFVVVITAMATLSVVSGLDLGIKILSNINMLLALALMFFILIAGEPLFVLREFVQSIGDYIGNFVKLSFRTMPYQGEIGEGWLGLWTTYYWGWWMSWSPFVGVFIARISRGRTVREFVLGVLLVPANLTFLWFSVLGGTALYHQIYGQGILESDNSLDAASALFKMLDYLPGGAIMSGLFLILIVVFFVTSSDSASFVIGMLSTGGNPNPPVATRVFWAVMEGAIAGVLLYVGALRGNLTGGLAALQTMTIIVAAPFSIVLLLTTASILNALNTEHAQRMRMERKLFAQNVEDKVVKTVIDKAVDSQVESYMEGKVDSYMEDKMETQVESYVEDKMGSQVADYVSSKMESQVESYVEDQLETYMDGQLETYVEDQLGSYVEGQLETYVEDQLGSYVEGQLETYMDDKVDEIVQTKVEQALQADN